MSAGRRAIVALAVVACGVAAAIWWRSDREAESTDGGQVSTSTPEESAETPSGAGDRPLGFNPFGGWHAPELSEDHRDTESIQIRVSGRVHHASTRAPVPWVDVIFSRGRTEWTATSNDRGDYELVMPPGDYQVRAVGDRVIGFGLPRLKVASEPRTYDVAVAEQAVVRGRARYRDGGWATGSIVVPYSTAKSVATLAARGEFGSAEVQADGSFELITIPGELVLRASDGNSSGSVAAGKVAPGGTLDGVEIVLVPNGHVAGVVRDPKGVPIPAANVLISVEVPGAGEYDKVPQVADESGRFRLQLPRAGAVIVEADAPGYAQSPPQRFTLSPGENREGIELTVREASHRLAGHVVDEQGEPLGFVEIAQGVEGSKARYKRTLTDSDGAFEITGVAAGPHRLRARKRGYKMTRLRQVTAPATDLEIVMPTAR